MRRVSHTTIKKTCADATQTRLTATDSLDLTDWTRLTRPVSPCSEFWFKCLAPRALVGRGGDFPWAWHGVLVALRCRCPVRRPSCGDVLFYGAWPRLVHPPPIVEDAFSVDDLLFALLAVFKKNVKT